MAYRVDPGLHREVARYGGGDITACMNCGICTATCPQSMETGGFPRRIIHLLQTGHREKLKGSLEPWLCYYCGECSETCPRDANPAETMMAARRYLTGMYDGTGLGRKFYASAAWEIGAVVLVGLFVVALFALFHGPVVTDRVALNTFAPVKWIEIGDWILGGVLAALLLSNGWRMFRGVMGSGKGPDVPFSLYLRKLPAFFEHFATQRKWRECAGPKTRWLKHFLLVTGYVTMMVLVIVFLRWFQTDAVVPILHPTRLFGYYATAVLLYVTVDFLAGRLRKRDVAHKFSEPTDWVFLVLLFLVALTGILVHAFRLAGLPMATYSTYVIHLAIVVPMLVVEVPFGKWGHMFYRPFAAYLAAVKQAAGAATRETARAA
ncbi:MAG: 4Fe-4S ferredoxin, iron-sulfur binding domain protein [Deltaproteobacteria bacterium]|nr:4Fe-4S ferredoxin, iron-sulfur binding domain protein [Deltaproteobacteria bacterium]MBS1243910.1 4Fe-4S ferredoxin, iron-sulfur binding domain protein [Deltaproteobacteria bacterium]